MILNRTAGGQKKYKITDNSNSGFPESAYAGEIVFATEDSYYVTVVGTSKRIIPVDTKSRILADSDVSTYAGSQEPYGFVMPAEDVTIS
jgi:hypothetical protein